MDGDHLRMVNGCGDSRLENEGLLVAPAHEATTGNFQGHLSQQLVIMCEPNRSEGTIAQRSRQLIITQSITGPMMNWNRTFGNRRPAQRALSTITFRRGLTREARKDGSAGETTIRFDLHLILRLVDRQGIDWREICRISRQVDRLPRCHLGRINQPQSTKLLGQIGCQIRVLFDACRP